MPLSAPLRALPLGIRGILIGLGALSLLGIPRIRRKPWRSKAFSKPRLKTRPNAVFVENTSSASWTATTTTSVCNDLIGFELSVPCLPFGDHVRCDGATKHMLKFSGAAWFALLKNPQHQKPTPSLYSKLTSLDPHRIALANHLRLLPPFHPKGLSFHNKLSTS